MNLASTIRMMGEKKDTPPFDVDKADYAGAAKELTAYAKKNGGIDKADFLRIANQLASLAKKKSAKVGARLGREVAGMDTDVREKIQSILKKFDISESMLEAWMAEEPASPDEASMAMTQLEFIEYAADEMKEHLEKNGDFPEWFQNKLSKAHSIIEGLHSSMGEHGEDEEELGEAKSKEQQIADLEKMLSKISGNTSSVKMKKYALQKKIDKLKNEELEEAYKTPAEAKAYEAGKKAWRDKKKYDTNPNKKGTPEHTAWSKGHNDARAKFVKKYGSSEEKMRYESVELDEAPKISTGKAKGSISATGLRGKGMKKFDVDVAVKGGKFEFRISDESGKFQTVGIKQAAKMLGEEVELEEARNPNKSGGSGYDLYHKDFSSAMQHAYKYAKEKLGIEIDPKEIDDKVASGPRKPSSGKTNSYRLVGKDGKKAVQIQVANLDNKKYELNMYKEETNMDINEAFEEMFGEETEYQKFFQSALKKFGVKSPSELDGEKEKEFYDYVDKNWKGKDEKPEPEDKQESLSFEDTLMKVLFGEAKKVSEEEDEEESEDEEGTDDKEDVKKKEKKKEKPEADDGTEPKDDTYKDIGKSGRQEKVSTKPSLDEADEKGEPMSDAEMKKRDDIMKGLEKKKKEFEDKYGDRAKEVMARTAIKMAKKLA